MSWTKTIPYKEADAKLKRIYDRIKTPGQPIDNVLSIHSLRPRTLSGHMTLYKSVLHNSNNTLPKWYLESIGIYVSMLNRCDYCVSHHFEGLKRIVKDDDKCREFYNAAKNGVLASFFEPFYLNGLTYARKLTLQPHTISEKDVALLKQSGFTEGEILEINQVTSYFNYVNRTVLGLGVTTKGDILGLSPNDHDDPDNWEHQ